MILSAHQPCYLPYLGFWNKVYNADLFVLLDSVQFEKGSYINCVQIKTAQGPHWLTIPVASDSYKHKIHEVNASDATWGYKHAIKVYDAYHKAEHYQPPKQIAQGVRLLDDALTANIGELQRIFKWTTPIVLQSWLDVEGTKQDLIINLCKHYNADAFLFGAKGRDYVDVEYFKSQGIEPLFQDFKCIEYPQQWGGGFVPGLSVIDALFNVGPEKTLDLIKGGYQTPEKYRRGK